MTTPIRLTDSQLQALLQAAEIVPRDRRDAFLTRAAAVLNSEEVGDPVCIAFAVAHAILSEAS